jgi:hypothetical protein
MGTMNLANHLDGIRTILGEHIDMSADDEIQINLEQLPPLVARKLFVHVKKSIKRERHLARRRRKAISEQKLAELHPSNERNVYDKLD